VSFNLGHFEVDLNLIDNYTVSPKNRTRTLGQYLSQTSTNIDAIWWFDRIVPATLLDNLP